MAPLILQASAEALDTLTDVLLSGGVAVIPTDTVYGLAALPGHPGAVERVFEIKERPAGMHLAVLVAGADQIPKVSADDRPGIAAVAEALWPGALTLVLQRATGLASGLGADDGTIGVRCPDHRFITDLAARVGPIAATSANLHGQPTPPTAAAVAEQLPSVDLVVDGGVCAGGLASTVVMLADDGPVELRSGPVSLDAVTAAWA